MSYVAQFVFCFGAGLYASARGYEPAQWQFWAICLPANLVGLVVFGFMEGLL